jgi:hypothetical protein
MHECIRTHARAHDPIGTGIADLGSELHLVRVAGLEIGERLGDQLPLCRCEGNTGEKCDQAHSEVPKDY